MRFATINFDFYFEDDFDLQSLLDELETMGLNPTCEEFVYEEDKEAELGIESLEEFEEEDEQIN